MKVGPAVGPVYRGRGKCEFTVWAPLAGGVSLKLLSSESHPRLIPMQRGEDGHWHARAEGVCPGALYVYQLDSRQERPDPASPFQPQGVHGPSAVVDHGAFAWTDEAWRGLPLSRMVLYELHVGTFTPEGTFEAVIPRLDDLLDLGITAVELMPVAQFPGRRNWGYDGVYPFAPQDAYGGPEGLKKLVNAAHEKGLAIVLDVVYNHLGPEGNYLWDFGPYFTDRYKTPWGQAVNFDGPYSDGVRNFFIQNALYWFHHYHFDALRLDAVHAVCDLSAEPFLLELSRAVRAYAEEAGRSRLLIAETDKNDARLLRAGELGGEGMHAQWSDDFHHALHALLTGERQGYYMDFGGLGHLVKAVREGYAYTGQYSAYRKRRQGNSPKDRPAEQFVVYIQNHDQVGNRWGGDRLSQLVSFEGLKTAAGLVLLSPFVPLLFMGEEYGEEAPFLYFVDHSDPDLIEAVRKGRAEEFSAFGWSEPPPDPKSPQTFSRSKIAWERREEGHHVILLNFHRTLLALRRRIPALSRLDKDRLEVWAHEQDDILYLQRWAGDSRIFCLFHLGRQDRRVGGYLPPGSWGKILDSADPHWKGPGSLLPEVVRAMSFAVYQSEEKAG